VLIVTAHRNIRSGVHCERDTNAAPKRRNKGLIKKPNQAPTVVKVGSLNKITRAIGNTGNRDGGTGKLTEPSDVLSSVSSKGRM